MRNAHTLVERVPARLRAVHLRYPRLVAATIVLTGGLLRLRQWLYGRGLWLDELALMHNVRDRGFRGLLHPLDLSQAAPPGWLWLERASLLLTGPGERSLRLEPLGFSLATLALVWYLAGRLLPGPGGWAVLALTAVNPYLITYANQAKQYSSEAFWVTLLVGYGVLLTRRRTGWWAPLGFWVLAIVGSTFSVTAIPVAFAVGAVLAVGALRDPWLFGAHKLVEVARVLAGYPAWLAVVSVMYLRLLRPEQQNPALQEYWLRAYPRHPIGDLPATWAWLLDIFRALASAPFGVHPSWVFGVALALAAFVCWRRCGSGVPLLLAVPALIGLVGSLLRLYPMYERLALFAVPAGFLLLGFVLAAPAGSPSAPEGRIWAARPCPPGRWRWLRPALGAALVLTLLVAPALGALRAAERPATAYGQFDAANTVQYREAVRYVADQHRDGDLVLGTDFSWFALSWYAPLDGVRPAGYLGVADRGSTCAPDDLATLLRHGKRVYLLEFTRWDEPGNASLTALLSHYGTVHTRLFLGSRVVEVDLDKAPVIDGTGDCAVIRPA